MYQVADFYGSIPGLVTVRINEWLAMHPNVKIHTFTHHVTGERMPIYFCSILYEEEENSNGDHV